MPTQPLFLLPMVEPPEFVAEVAPSMVGVNLGISCSYGFFFSFGGSKDSFLEMLKFMEEALLEFFTEKHTTMTRWYVEGMNDAVSPVWKSE